MAPFFPLSSSVVKHRWRHSQQVNDNLERYPFRVSFMRRRWKPLNVELPGIVDWCNELGEQTWRWTVLREVDAEWDEIAVMFADEAHAVECKLRFG